MSITSSGIMTWRRTALLIIFFTSIYAPSLAGLFSQSGGVSHIENRFLAQMPLMELNRDSINAFPDRFEKYFSDNFAGRLGLVSGYNRLHYSIGVSWTKNVIIGKNGWLFYQEEIPSYRKTNPFNDIQMTMWRWKMRLIKGWLEERGIKLLFLIAPNKSSIYPEQMPDNINVAGKVGCFDQLSDVARDLGIEFVDPRKDLIERKKGDELYLRLDTHWNDTGAYVSYNLLMKHLGKWFAGLSPIPQSSLGFTTVAPPVGNLARMLGLSSGSIGEKVKQANLEKYLNKREPLNGADLPNAGASLRFDTGNAGPRILIFRDSFSNSIITLLSIHFSRITAIWGHGWFSGELVEKEKPDVVIYEIVEQFLIDGPNLLGDAGNLLKSLYNVTLALESPHIYGDNIMDETVPESYVRYAKSGSTLHGNIMYGPYVTLKQGEYQAVFRMKSNGKSDSPVVTIKVTTQKGRKTLGSKTLRGADFVPDKWGNFIVNVKTGPDDEKDVEFVADYLGGADVSIESSWFEKAGEKPLDIYDEPPSAPAKIATLP